MRDFSIWQQCFVAALTGSARDPYPPEKDEQYLLNRAERIADAAEARIEQRRKVHVQTRGLPPPLPVSTRRS